MGYDFCALLAGPYESAGGGGEGRVLVIYIFLFHCLKCC